MHLIFMCFEFQDLTNNDPRCPVKCECWTCNFKIEVHPKYLHRCSLNHEQLSIVTMSQAIFGIYLYLKSVIFN